MQPTRHKRGPARHELPTGSKRALQNSNTAPCRPSPLPPFPPHTCTHIRIYAGGDTEPIVGRIIANSAPPPSPSSIGTKCHPSQPGGLSPAGIDSQLETSLAALSLPSVGELYLHQPDPSNSLLDSLRTLDTLHKAGKITAIGLSNYHASEVQRAFDLCAAHSLTPPTVYQGIYSPLNRLVEDELLPILRTNGCSFVAYVRERSEPVHM